ncbi:MAG: hypothetical protein RQ723_00760 [Desulfuromonadales bacterium]|nr:hypothetical protein [Desulfuromonadales bacterium]
MQLLNPLPPSDLPAEALYARLRSRRAGLRTAPLPDGIEPVTVETELRAVLNWVFRRMDRRLRRQLGPYLEIVAMRQLILWLRYRLAKETPPAAVQRSTLINLALLDRLETIDAPLRLVETLEALLAADYPLVDGLGETWLKQGPGGVEQQLGRGILEHGRAQVRQPTVRQLILGLIDLRNVLTIVKSWHWQVRAIPRLVAGGELAGDELLRVWQRQDRRRLSRLVSRVAGHRTDSGQPRGIEKALLDGLTRRLQRAGRDPLSPALVLDYLWLCQVQAHNRLIRQAGPLLPDGILAEALLA